MLFDFFNAAGNYFNDLHCWGEYMYINILQRWQLCSNNDLFNISLYKKWKFKNIRMKKLWEDKKKLHRDEFLILMAQCQIHTWGQITSISSGNRKLSITPLTLS